MNFSAWKLFKLPFPIFIWKSINILLFGSNAIQRIASFSLIWKKISSINAILDLIFGFIILEILLNLCHHNLIVSWLLFINGFNISEDNLKELDLE